MYPGIANKNLSTKCLNDRQQRASQIAKAHETNGLARKQKGVLVVSFSIERLSSRTDGCICLVDASCQRKSHSKSHLCYRLCEDRCSRQNSNSAAVALKVVDVWQKVALNIEHDLQLRCTIQSLLVQGGLTDQRNRIR